MNESVLIVTDEKDSHAEVVRALLERDHGVSVHYCDMRRFPTRMVSSWRAGTAQYASIKEDGLGFSLQDVRSVWWRCPEACLMPDIGDEPTLSFMQMESQQFLEGLLWSNDCLWVNNPQANRFASRKVVQLNLAQSLGLKIPDSLITNDPDRARAFVEAVEGRVVVRRVGSDPSCLKDERSEEIDQLQALTNLRHCPVLLQERIQSHLDFRVTYIDGDLWPAAVHARSDVKGQDLQISEAGRCEPCTLPMSVSLPLQQMMEKLGLKFGVIDLRLGVDGRYYFLGANPYGQFMDIQLRTGMPLAEAMAALLASPFEIEDELPVRVGHGSAASELQLSASAFS